jgi:transposase
MRVERIDDLGLLAAVIRSTKLAEAVDSHFPEHGNWQGPSMGKIVSCWLMYILSEADHRLSHVEQWADGRIGLLRTLLEAPDLEPQHLCDQHLEVMLDYFSDEEAWTDMVCTHSQGLLNVYPMDDGMVRLDAMITKSYREIGGMFQRGHSKQHNPELPQLKEMIAAAGMYAVPVATEIVAGNRADDQLYLKAADKARKALRMSGLLFVGDGKMASLETRGTLHSEGDSYLTSLPLQQLSREDRLNALKNGPQRSEMQEVWSEPEPGKEAQLKAYGFTSSRQVSYKGMDGQEESWEEQVVHVCSVAYLDAQLAKLANNLSRAEAALDDLLRRKPGRKAIKDPAELARRVEAILDKEGVGELIEVNLGHSAEVRKIKGRGGNPEREEVSYSFSLSHRRREEAIREHKSLLGWQAYGTNCTTLTFGHAVEIYRGQYRIEHRFDQLLNRTLRLLPLYIKIESRVCALIRLLVLALQFCAVIEYQTRKTLEENPELPDVEGLYPGHPGRKTRKPTVGMVLVAFRDVSLVFHTGPQGEPAVSLTGLTQNHEYLLRLAGISEDFYHLTAQAAARAETATQT